MNSTWLLLKTQAKRLLVGASLCFLIFFLLVYYDAEPSKPEKAHQILPLTLMIPLMFTCFAGFHTALFRFPFPVTHRQLAFIPTLCMTLLWTSGIAGALAGMLVVDERLYRWTSFNLAAINILPLVFLVFATMDRLMRYVGFNAIGYTVLFTSVLSGKQFRDLESLETLYQYTWPLGILFGILFVVEGPAHIATMDHPIRTKQGWYNLMIRTPGAPLRQPAMKTAADLAMALVLMTFLLILCSPMLRSLTNIGAESTNAKLFFGVLFILSLFGIRYVWRSAHANGFSANKTFTIFLMYCSLVFIPIAWALGAKRGSVASCDHCRQSKFIWAHRCPYCNHANQGTVLRALPTAPWKKDAYQPPKRHQVNSRRGYRIALPCYLLFFVLITGRTSYFHRETLIITLTHEAMQPPATALEPIREYLASIDDPRAWLTENADEPLLLPERFRMEFTDHPIEFNVRCYWPRWEKAGPVGERIKKRIREAFPNGPLSADSHVSENDYARVYANRAALPSFLDQGIHVVHWKKW